MAVPALIPSCRVIFCQDAPVARRLAIFAVSTVTRGLPSVFPLARAFRRPAKEGRFRLRNLLGRLFIFGRNDFQGGGRNILCFQHVKTDRLILLVA